MPTIEDLLADPRNPRAISEDAAEGLRASLTAFGDIAGLTWNQRTGQMVAGHQRLNALKAEAERRGVDLTVGDGSILLPAGDGKPAERFNLRVVDWTDQQQAAANLTANNPHIGGVFTNGLGSMLAEVEASMPELFASARMGELKAEAERLSPASGGAWDSALGGLATGDKAPFQQMTFTVSDEQAEQVRAALERAKDGGPFVDTGNENGNGNALARICETFLGGGQW